MKHITDDDLILLYYGEHDDTQLARQVAESPELSERFDRLCRDLEPLNELATPEKSPDYGAEIWSDISSGLAGSRQTSGAASWIQSLFQPRFSLAGLASLTMVAVIAFWLGSQSHPADPLPTAIAQWDSDQLLANRVAMHLNNTDSLLTQLSNAPGDTAASAREREAMWAGDLLVSNRLYRRAAMQAGHTRLASLLTELEPLLLELAHDDPRAPSATRKRLEQEADNELLFKVRVMNRQLKATETPI